MLSSFAHLVIAAAGLALGADVGSPAEEEVSVTPFPSQGCFEACYFAAATEDPSDHLARSSALNEGRKM